jgi:RpiB/LacA/LacB family sugar-phosphate isomerase
MLVAIGADHAGFSLKQDLVTYLKSLNLEVLDLGTNSADPVDYPDFAEAVGRAIVEGDAERGLLVCGSGVGASVAANKIPGIRAGLCHDTYSARQGVEHDDMNVLVLGARVIGPELARELVRVYIEATFSGAERHRRRLEKIARLEKK